MALLKQSIYLIHLQLPRISDDFPIWYIFVARQRSCGKAIFSVMCVCLSVFLFTGEGSPPVQTCSLLNSTNLDTMQLTWSQSSELDMGVIWFINLKRELDMSDLSTWVCLHACSTRQTHKITLKLLWILFVAHPCLHEEQVYLTLEREKIIWFPQTKQFNMQYIKTKEIFYFSCLLPDLWTTTVLISTKSFRRFVAGFCGIN